MLGRAQVEVDLETAASYLTDQTVLVTGAGGSIGSELCRQISRARPARLVLVENGETALFEIERELLDERGFSAAIPILGDVCNRPKMRQVFERYRPTVVFHAAAYKHVPLMEANPLESVRNNALATKAIADVAAEFGADRFVLVSTDKAVNPKTVMGQSKALCEWIVEAYGAARRRLDALRRRPLRQRPRLVGLRDPDLPPPDREGRAGDSHPSGHDALLHDHPGGRIARRAGRRDRRQGRDLRARHGRAGADPRPGAQHDPPLRQGARPRHPDRVRRAHGRARSCTRSFGAEEEAVRPTSHPKILRVKRPGADPSVLEARARRPGTAGSRTARRLEVVARLRGLVLRGAVPLSAETPTEVAEITHLTLFRAPFARESRRRRPARSLGWAGWTADAIFEGLNAEQRRAVEAVRGPVVILAGAGSGKTTTITRRIAWQVATGTFAAPEILAVTFTDKAAGEMRARLGRLGIDGIRARTFHASALQQLHYFGRGPGGVLPSKALMLRHIANSLPRPYRFRPAADLATEIEWAKNRRISADRYEELAGERDRGAAARPDGPRLPRVRAAQGGSGLVDFEDLLELTIRMYEEDANAVAEFRSRCRAITVDEFQDVNLLQQPLARALARGA